MGGHPTQTTKPFTDEFNMQYAESERFMNLELQGAFGDSLEAKILMNSYDDLMQRIHIQDSDKPIVVRNALTLIEQISKIGNQDQMIERDFQLARKRLEAQRRRNRQLHQNIEEAQKVIDESRTRQKELSRIRPTRSLQLNASKLMPIE